MPPPTTPFPPRTPPLHPRSPAPSPPRPPGSWEWGSPCSCRRADPGAGAQRVLSYMVHKQHVSCKKSVPGPLNRLGYRVPAAAGAQSAEGAPTQGEGPETGVEFMHPGCSSGCRGAEFITPDVPLLVPGLFLRSSKGSSEYSLAFRLRTSPCARGLSACQGACPPSSESPAAPSAGEAWA